MESTLSSRLDRTGVVASVSCAVHCMIAPLIVLLAPALGGFWVHPGTHLLIASLVLPVAAFALRRGFRHHGKRSVVLGGALGMTLVFAGTALPFLMKSERNIAAAAEAEANGETHVCEDCCPTLVEDEETGEVSLRVPPASIVTLLGGILLVTIHMVNLRCCAGCSPRVESAGDR
ncbi:MAG: MerC domain-containing protein [Planctomycetota bacterium]